jgi:uncharacterized membrane protein YccC
MSWEDPTYADFIGAIIAWVIVIGLAFVILPYVSPAAIVFSLLDLVRMYKKIQEKKRK